MQVPGFQETMNAQLLESAPGTDQEIWAPREYDKTLRATHHERKQWVTSSMALWHLRRQAYYGEPYWTTILSFVIPGDDDINDMALTSLCRNDVIDDVIMTNRSGTGEAQRGAPFSALK